MQVREIRAINGPYPPTFDGIRDAIEACHYGQGLGVTGANIKLLVVHEDGSQEPVPVGDDSLDEAYEAAEIAHRFGIPHKRSLCQSCVME